ncbi:unnamed protein product [Brassicogethes aeneus]|uniref:LRRCT domain-containing protein n=1 Tax=Brassicogethes aeneus TaxID=1431903 RepID=A0A9P0B7K8_BRAAE|nr:unnamed protein product [Brassicogethes aeneus]
MNCHCVLMLLFSGLINRISAQSGCPPLESILPCRCLMRGDEYQIWCSHSDLPRVLDGLRSVGHYITRPIDELILENNYLPSLPGKTFIHLKVMRLMLRYNGLERVSSDWLGGLGGSLMELFIVEPELRTLPEDSLLHLNSLEAITVQTNLMKRLPLISRLPNLRYVQVESLSLLEISPRNFKDNPRLEKLHITMSPRLTRLEANVLIDLPSLNLINISYCGVNWMHPRALSNLPALKELAFVGNKIIDAGMIGRGSRDLPELEVIKLDYNYIDKIGEASFVDLPALKKLHLSNNLITELHHGAFHRVPQLRSLDLNRNNLRRVHPESFLQHSGSGLEELWLVENDISHVAELRSLLDALPRLQFLDMSYNNLEAIPFGALRGHPTLEYLHLDYNKIHLIDREAFMAMPALRELRLKNNSLSDMLEGPLWNLPALKGLDLSGNFFRRLEPEFLANLPALRRIDVSLNELTFIDPAFFILTPELEHVNISFNALSALHPATFRHLLGLYELDISHNRLLEFVPGLPRGIEYLHMSHNQITALPLQPSPDLDLPSLRLLDISSNRIHKLIKGGLITMPQLRRLYVSHNLIQSISETALEGLNRLETLDFHENRITEIHPYALKEMIELRELNLRNNRLDILLPDVFKNAPMLKLLDISRNQISEILPGTLDKNRELQVIDASHNGLVQLSSTFFGLKNLQILDLTKNRLKHIDTDILNSLTSLKELKASKNFIQELKQGAFNSLQHLKTLDLDNNELEFIEPHAIRALPLLKSLKLSKNKLKELPNSAFSNLPLLQKAELQENQLRLLGPNTFNIVPHLLMLNMSHNQLLSVEDAGLRSLRSLEMLDLSKNRLNRVAGANLEKMEWLVELRMDDNNICGVQGSFNNMPRLRVLTMKNNKMMTFPEQAVERLRGNIAVLDIEGNPLVCSCNLMWLQNWLQESSSNGPRCVDGTLLREMRLSRQECTENQNNLDMVAPGCEAELLSAPGQYGTSQVFSQWQKLKSNKTKDGIRGNLPPSPEESEYFYDEYVDYQYNDTAVPHPNNGLDFKQQLVETITIKPIAPSTTKSPHYTVGDTPTIYAAPQNKTKPDIPKEVVNSPSTSGFTFFGVPLPSLNLNNLLKGNLGRMSDKKQQTPLNLTPPPIIPTITAQRKTAIVNKPTGNGRRGIEPPPKERFSLPASQLNPIVPMMPNEPEIQTGGFKPILPGTGGFKPMVSPTQKPNVTMEVETSTLKSQESKEVVSTVKPPLFVSNTTMFVRREDLPKNKPPVVLPSKVDSNSVKNITQEPPKDKVEVLNKAKIEEVSKDEIKTLLQQPVANDFPKDFDSIESEILTTENSAITLPSPQYPTTTLAVPTTKKFEGSPLSALLVPDGQQPLFKPSGRPSIQKVQSPYLKPTQENPEAAEPLKNNREGKNRQPDTEDVAIDETNWYFANYNKTNVEPYVGKIVNSQNNAGNLVFMDKVICILVFAVSRFI